MVEDRIALRTKILAERDSLPLQEQKRKSGIIAELLLALPEFIEARSVFVYVSFRSEVETSTLIAHCLSRGMTVSVPLTLPAEHRLLAYAITDPGRDFVPGYCGIAEPVRTLPLVDPASIEVVVTPGSVFDLEGGRLGYGGGFYDRFLQTAAPQALRIALAYDLQLVEVAPLESHDQQMDYLVTESSVIHFRRTTS